MKILLDNLLMQPFYIQNRNMCLSKKTCNPIPCCFFDLLGTASPIKAFYILFHSTKDSLKLGK